MYELSNDVNIITAQIHFLEEDLDRTMNERAFQIGKLLNHVKEGIQYGGFTNWINNNFKFSKTYGYNFMSYYNQNKDVQSTGQLPSFTKEVEIMALTSGQKEEIRTQAHIIPSTGETKKYDDLTNKELREVTKQLKETERERVRFENESVHYRQLLNQERSKPSQVVTKEIKVEVVPERVTKELEQLKFDNVNLKHGFQSTKEKLMQYELRNTVDFDAEQSRKQREKMQHEADFNTLELRVHITNFLEKAAISSFMQGAITASDPITKRKLQESINMLENFTTQIKAALNGRILGGIVNE